MRKSTPPTPPTFNPTPDPIEFIRMCALRGMLNLEIKGMRRSRSPSAYSIIKRHYGLRGTRERVLVQLEDMIEQVKIEHGIRSINDENRT